MTITLSPSNDDREILETCIYCLRPFYELRAYKAKALEFGFYVPVCIDCDDGAQAVSVDITDSGQRVLLAN